MKTTTGTAAGYAPRPVASILGMVQGTGAPASRPRIDAFSPLAEPDSSPEALTH